MHVVRIQQIDAFTQQPFQGNPAGVVIDADTLTDREMQLIAREMNASETAFVMNSDEDLADLRLRWFTPDQEVALCGHATIAAFHALAAEGRFYLEVGEEQSFMVETRSGILQVDVDWHQRFPFIKFSLPIPQFDEFPGDWDLLMNALNLYSGQIDKDFNPLVDQNGYLYLMVEDRQTLSSIRLHTEQMLELKEKHEVLAVAAGTTDTVDSQHDWDLRFFAPALGVPEDPVTGSANGPMACYLLEHGKVSFDDGELILKGQQGRFMDRSGTVHTLLRGHQQQVDELKIAGSAVTVLDGNISLPGKNSE